MKPDSNIPVMLLNAGLSHRIMGESERYDRLILRKTGRRNKDPIRYASPDLAVNPLGEALCPAAVLQAFLCLRLIAHPV